MVPIPIPIPIPIRIQNQLQEIQEMHVSLNQQIFSLFFSLWRIVYYVMVLLFVCFLLCGTGLRADMDGILGRNATFPILIDDNSGAGKYIYHILFCFCCSIFLLLFYLW